MRARSLRRAPALRFFAAAAVAASLSLARPAIADAPVKVGEVSTLAGQEDAATTIRSTLAQELAKVKVPPGRRYVVSASLVKLESKSSGKDVTTTATVSLAVRDAKNGAIRGVVNGSSLMTARATDGQAKKEVVESAVRGATKNLPVVIAKE